MPFTRVQICNMALGNIGITKFISDLSERSAQAELCSQYYEPARDWTLEDFPWPFATKYGEPGLVEEEPNDDWDYSYRYPDDCVFVRRIVTALGRSNPNPPPFKTGSDDQGRLIYTSEATPVIEYTRLVDDETLFPAVFAFATSWWLSGLIAPGLARDKKQAQMAFQMYAVIKGQAQAQQLNEAQQTTEPESEFIRARE